MNDLLGNKRGDPAASALRGYRLQEPLGRGGMGLVYSAIQEGLGRRVAIKILDARLAEDRDQLERFRREAEMVAALGHPNIVQVTDFQYPEKDGDQPFLVMELLRGESLGMLLVHEQVLSAQRAAFISSQVLSALTAAHRAGIVHRDIKPDNIFILSEAAVPDTVKVLDFGIAKLAVEGQAKLTGTGAMLGTPAFMAPEQARGEPDVDARADLYAVGATMYQALSGKLPYEAPSIPALLFAIVEKAPPPLHVLRPDLPADLVAVVERAMSKDRNARFANADDMRRALAPWSGLPATLPPPTSATAATIASGSVPMHEQATPIVVHHTPASAKPATLDTPKPESRPSGSNATRVMIFVAVLFAIAGLTTVAILKVMKSGEPEKTASVATRPISSALPPMPSFAINVPTPSIDVAAIVASATNLNVPTPHIAPTTITTTTTTTATSELTALSPVPTEGKRYGGARGRFSSSDFSGCAKCDWQTFNQSLRDHDAAISACFKASTHEPPHHETPYYEVSVAPSGAIIGAHSTSDGAPNLDRCLRTLMMSIPLHKDGGDPGSFKISFAAACKPGMENIPGSCD